MASGSISLWALRPRPDARLGGLTWSLNPVAETSCWCRMVFSGASMYSLRHNRDETILHGANDRSNIVGDFFYDFVGGFRRNACIRPACAARRVRKRRPRAFVQSVVMCSKEMGGTASTHIGEPVTSKSCHIRNSGRACVQNTKDANERTTNHRSRQRPFPVESIGRRRKKRHRS